MSKIPVINLPAIALASVIALFIAWQFYSITSERDEAVSNLNKTVQLVRDNAMKAEAEKVLLAEQGAAQREADKAEGIRNAQIIGNAYYSMVKDAKNETTKVKIDSVATADKLRDQLREQSAIVASRKLPGDDEMDATRKGSDTTLPGRIGEESAEFYRTAYLGAVKDLKVCKLSGASCASDFNHFRKYVLGEQSRLGTEDK